MERQKDKQPKLETLLIELSTATIDSWKSNAKEKCSKLAIELERNDFLISFINRYQKDRWEVHSIDEVLISEQQDNRGEIQLEFTKHFFSGCKDNVGEDEDYLNISFEINYSNLEIAITGEPVPEERSTFEEF